MRTFKIILAYDGTEFVGWQRQATGTSVQGLLEDALRVLDDRQVTVTGAGRTDAGVHALGQVAAFTLARTIAPDVLVRALNAGLPESVRVLSAEETPKTFHPRFDARAKTYRYRMWLGPVMNPFDRWYAWHIAGPVDVGAMCAAARCIEGRHDFAAFQSAGSDVSTTERTILSSRIAECGLRIDCGLPLDDGSGFPSAIGHREFENKSALRTPQSALLVYTITGDGFLRHMVRTIVGSLVEIGRGRHPITWINDVIASRARAMAGPTAPAAGLFLVSVDYGAALADEA